MKMYAAFDSHAQMVFLMKKNHIDMGSRCATGGKDNLSARKVFH